MEVGEIDLKIQLSIEQYVIEDDHIMCLWAHELGWIVLLSPIKSGCLLPPKKTMGIIDFIKISQSQWKPWCCLTRGWRYKFHTTITQTGSKRNPWSHDWRCPRNRCLSRANPYEFGGMHLDPNWGLGFLSCEMKVSLPTGVFLMLNPVQNPRQTAT